MKKVSIIIPAYNVEEYVSECLESVISQTYENIEIVIINDGSTDNTLVKIKDTLENYKGKTIIIDKKNEGVSQARNNGIEKSTGEYIICLDADDKLINNNGIKKLMDYLEKDEKCDILLFRNQVLNMSDGSLVDNKKYEFDIKKDKIYNINSLIKDSTLSVTPWRKVIKKRLITDNDIKFLPNTSAEDITWSLLLYLKAEKIYCDNNIYYLYRANRQNSLTSNMKYENIIDLFNIVKFWINYDYNNEEEKTMIYNFIAYEYSILITSLNNKNSNKELVNSIKEYKWILDYTLNYKVKLVRKLIKIFGFKIGPNILKIYIKLKIKGKVKI